MGLGNPDNLSSEPIIAAETKKGLKMEKYFKFTPAGYEALAEAIKAGLLKGIICFELVSCCWKEVCSHYSSFGYCPARLHNMGVVMIRREIPVRGVFCPVSYFAFPMPENDPEVMKRHPEAFLKDGVLVKIKPYRIEN